LLSKEDKGPCFSKFFFKINSKMIFQYKEKEGRSWLIFLHGCKIELAKK